MINLSSQTCADFLLTYLFIIHSSKSFICREKCLLIQLICLVNGSITTETMHVTCGTNIELTCPIRSTKKSDEVVCPWEK